MRVGILGSGLMGGKLGTIFARAGHEVVFSYARSVFALYGLLAWIFPALIFRRYFLVLIAILAARGGAVPEQSTDGQCGPRSRTGTHGRGRHGWFCA
jgi:hypothetical protein